MTIYSPFSKSHFISNNLAALSDGSDFERYLLQRVDKRALEQGLVRRNVNVVVPKRIGGTFEGGPLNLSDQDLHLLGTVGGVKFVEHYVEWIQKSKE